MSKANPRYRRFNQTLPAPTGNVWRVRHLGYIESQMTLVTYYYVDDAFPGTADDTIRGNLITGLLGISAPPVKLIAACSSDWESAGLFIDSPNNPAFATAFETLFGPGTGPAGHEPTTVCVTIDKQTAVKGQCGRGRISVPAVPTAWVTDSKLSTLTAHGALSAALFGTLTGGSNTFTPGIYSKGTRVSNQKGFAPLTVCTLKTTLGTARRRKLGRGK